MCLGAASAKDRLDVVCRDAINAGRIPGPRYLANGPEIAVTGGALIKSITKFADGPEGMRKAVRELIDIGVDQIKLSMTGEEITGTQRAEDTYFSDEEVAAAVTEAHRRGKRVCAHARSAESVKMCVRNKVDIIYHASFTDAEGMDMLEANKDWVFVAPGINWLVATLYEAEAFGFPQEAAEAVGYKKELEIGHRRACARCTAAASRSCPAATTASPGPRTAPTPATWSTSSSCSASPRWRRSSRPPRWGGEIMLRPDELGKVQPGYLADLLLVDGDPLADITDPAGPRQAALHHEGRQVPQGERRRRGTRPGPGQHARQRHRAVRDPAPLTPAREADTRDPGCRPPAPPGADDDPADLPHLPALRHPRQRRVPPRARRQIARNPAADPRTVRHVQCLGGCPEDGVAAVDGPGKTRVRFNGLHAGHADALITAARAHAASPTGAPDEWDIPAELADHVSSITYKRGPIAPSPAPSHNPQPTSYVWRKGSRLSQDPVNGSRSDRQRPQLPVEQVGNPAARHALNPPSRSVARCRPRSCSDAAARLDV